MIDVLEGNLRDYQVIGFLREHALMRTMGWTRKDLEEFSFMELEMHYAVLEYDQLKADSNKLHMDHESNKIGRAS